MTLQSTQVDSINPGDDYDDESSPATSSSERPADQPRPAIHLDDEARDGLSGMLATPPASSHPPTPPTKILNTLPRDFDGNVKTPHASAGTVGSIFLQVPAHSRHPPTPSDTLPVTSKRDHDREAPPVLRPIQLIPGLFSF